MSRPNMSRCNSRYSSIDVEATVARIHLNRYSWYVRTLCGCVIGPPFHRRWGVSVWKGVCEVQSRRVSRENTSDPTKGEGCVWQRRPLDYDVYTNVPIREYTMVISFFVPASHRSYDFTNYSMIQEKRWSQNFVSTYRSLSDNSGPGRERVLSDMIRHMNYTMSCESIIVLTLPIHTEVLVLLIRFKWSYCTNEYFCVLISKYAS